MQVLDGVEQSLRKRYDLDGKDLFERKKQIIKSSLYGVEVKEWAVWICQLRLWLSLFVDAPDDLKNSLDAILPSLDFKVRQGDSLVQRVGSKAFPVSGHNIALSKSIKDKITKLKNLKLQYFDNKSEFQEWELKQRELAIYEEILHTEISEKEVELRQAKDVKPTKALSLFSEEKEEPEQIKLSFNQEIIQKLENEIAELKEKRQQLRNGGKPLVWSIEFADVFGEKGGFDVVIGNPPYVRQEDIADPTGKVKDKKEYKGYLQEMVKLDFPDHFLPKTKINAQSDLYTYFYIRALRLLNPNGVHTFICSNSWLDVGYGVWLQEFLLNRCPVELIIDNHSKRSFEAADVNTIISIIHAPQKNVENDHLVKFVAFKKPFESSIFTENLITIENASEVIASDAFRVFPMTNNDLKEAGTEYDEQGQTTMKMGKYIGDKWGGKYLRAPDIFFTILKKGKDKFVKLSAVTEIKRGFTTGINGFFYLTNDQVRFWNIESEYIKHVIKGPKECKKLYVDTSGLKYNVFLCDKSKKDLQGTNALKYIEWGEKQKTEDGVLWKDVPTVSGRRYWWDLGVRNFPDAVWVKSVNQIHGQSILPSDVMVDQRLYELCLVNKTHKDKISVLINSSIMFLFKEITGRANMGEGVLDSSVYEAKLTYVLNPEIIPSLKFSNYSFKSIFEECGIDPKSSVPIEYQDPKPLPDRVELDNIVFDALKLSVEERKDVYRAVCRLVWNRINKANSV